MQTLRFVLKLLRLDSSLSIFLVVFVPLFAKTRDLNLSLSKAIPLLFIAICTFIANALDDVEKDRINHPERPLPSGQIKPSFAAALYFVFLASALFATKFYVRANIAFWYYALLTLSVSYGYIVDCFPGFKSLYVASATAVTVWIAAISCAAGAKLYIVAGSVFFFILGKELCMDFVDRAGDPVSFMHKIQPKPLAIAAFTSQAIGLLSLATQVDKLTDVMSLFLMLLLFALSSYFWFKLAKHEGAIALMKAQLVIGMCFLA